MPAPRRIPSFDTTDPADPWFMRGAELDLVYWDDQAKNWRPVNGEEFRALLRGRRAEPGG